MLDINHQTNGDIMMTCKLPTIYVASIWFLDFIVKEAIYIRRKKVTDWLTLIEKITKASEVDLGFVLPHQFLCERAIRTLNWRPASLTNDCQAFEFLIHLVNLFHQDLLVHTPNIRDKLLSLKKHPSKQKKLWEYWNECLVFANQL